MSNEQPAQSMYRSRGFRLWKFSTLASWADNSAWAARWYAEQAGALAAIEGAPPAVGTLVMKAQEAAFEAARAAGIVSEQCRRASTDESVSYSTAWERARIGAGWCTKADRALAKITALLETAAKTPERR